MAVMWRNETQDPAMKTFSSLSYTSKNQHQVTLTPLEICMTLLGIFELVDSGWVTETHEVLKEISSCYSIGKPFFSPFLENCDTSTSTS